MTTVKLMKNVWQIDKNVKIFKIKKPKHTTIETIHVNNFQNGIATVTINVIAGNTIRELANILLGCFEVKSNFTEEINLAYNVHGIALKGFEINVGVGIIIPLKKGDTSKEIYQEYLKKLDEKARTKIEL